MLYLPSHSNALKTSCIPKHECLHFRHLQPPSDAGLSDVLQHLFPELPAGCADSFLKLWHVTGHRGIHLALDIASHKKWCAMSNIGLVGSSFCCDASGNMTTVTEENYLEMLLNLAVPQLQERSDLTNVFFYTKWSPSHLCQVSEGFHKHQVS